LYVIYRRHFYLGVLIQLAGDLLEDVGDYFIVKLNHAFAANVQAIAFQIALGVLKDFIGHALSYYRIEALAIVIAIHATHVIRPKHNTIFVDYDLCIIEVPARRFDPMARNDHRVDAIGRNVAATDFQIHDAYYDHSDADRDINCQFPIDRLRELARSGEIGAVAARFWSGFMGRTYNRSKLMQESAPAFAAQLREDRVDLLIAVPA